MGGWIGTQIFKEVNSIWKDDWVNGHMDGWMDGWLDVSRWMDGCLDAEWVESRLEGGAVEWRVKS